MNFCIKLNHLNRNDTKMTKRKLSNHFFEQNKKPKIQVDLAKIIHISLPDNPALFNELPAAGEHLEASQGHRLSLIKETICKHSDYQDIHNEQDAKALKDLLVPWHPLFHAIGLSDYKKALVVLNNLLESKNNLLQLLLKVHDSKLLMQLVEACTNLSDGSAAELYPEDEDCIVTSQTFEALIKDICQSVCHTKKINLSIGLPTHHAHYQKASGFCLLNKTAVMIHHLQQKNTGMTKPLPFIIGTDVNRDDGLLDIMIRDKAMPFIHIDICDLRVYPNEKIDSLKANLSTLGFDYRRTKRAHIFVRGEQHYHLVNLDDYKFEPAPGRMHPALQYARNELTHILKANKKIHLILASGFDSSKHETSACAMPNHKNGQFFSQQDFNAKRFDNSDFESFFHFIANTLTKYPDNIEHLYYSLEGGYKYEIYQKMSRMVMDKMVSAADRLSQAEYNSQLNP